MITKLALGMALIFVSISGAAQVVSPTYRPKLSTSVGAGMDYMSGDWGALDINRFGPTAWATVTVWHDLSLIAEGHSMVAGGNRYAPLFKYVAGGGGVVYTSDYWGRFQPYVQGEIGFGSLSHPDNFSGHFHDTRRIYAIAGGFEYHTWNNLWTRVGYTYDFFPDFHSSITGHNPALNPRGFIFGETLRFGPSGSRY